MLTFFNLLLEKFCIMLKPLSYFDCFLSSQREPPTRQFIVLGPFRGKLVAFSGPSLPGPGNQTMQI